MQGHGNDEEFGRRLGNELCDGLGQQFSELARGGTKALILKRMNHFPHPALVGAIGNGPHEWGRSETAGAANAGLPGNRWLIKGIAAANARRAGVEGNFGPAGITDWHRREAREGRSAKSAE